MAESKKIRPNAAESGLPEERDVVRDRVLGRVINTTPKCDSQGQDGTALNENHEQRRNLSCKCSLAPSKHDTKGSGREGEDGGEGSNVAIGRKCVSRWKLNGRAVAGLLDIRAVAV